MLGGHKSATEQILDLAGFDLTNRLHDGGNMRLHQTPVIRRERKDSNEPTRYRILVGHILVFGDQQVITAVLGKL